MIVERPWVGPGFPRGDANLKRGAKLLFSQNFPNEVNWTERGDACPKFVYVDLPLIAVIKERKYQTQQLLPLVN